MNGHKVFCAQYTKKAIENNVTTTEGYAYLTTHIKFLQYFYIID